jgi:catechol 2,3-dioxygenase-like lactoylglutathione lyase family enzyme
VLEGVSHIMLAGRDLDRSFAFYTEGLGLRVVSRWAGGEYLAAGEDSITLILDPRDGPLPEDTYLAFSVSPKSFDAARKRLRNAGALVWKDTPPTEGRSFYFGDPDDHKLEIYISSLLANLEADRRISPTGTRFYP